MTILGRSVYEIFDGLPGNVVEIAS
jgi:Ca2+-binding EF-hand superfamily protein